MHVLVCGGRTYDDSRRVYAVLDKLDAEAGIEVLMHGGARGADEISGRWAENCGRCRIDVYEADWENHGRFAGPMRNQRMLDEGRPDVVIAFPGGRGTADMVRKARKAGVKVVEIAHA